MNRTVFVLLFIILPYIGVHAQGAADSTRHVKLGEVTVRGADVIMGQDKITAFVSNAVKKHSYDGYSALQQMMLPGIDVDVFSAKIQAYGEAPVIAINGIRASSREVKTLNPKAIIRIDYYTGYNPAFPQANYVIDFIIKVPENGGRVMLQATQHLNRPTGNDMIDWRTFGKSHEFGISAGLDFDHYANAEASASSTWMELNQGLVFRSSRQWSNANNSNSPIFSAYYTRRLKDGTFKATTSVGFPHLRKKDSHIADVTYPDEPMEEVEHSTIFRHNGRRLARAHLYYDHKFSDKSKLTLTASATGSHSTNHRDWMEPDQDVYSLTKEDFQGVATSANYTVPIRDKHSAVAQANFNYSHSGMDYAENGNASSNSLSNTTAVVTIGDNIRFTSDLSLFGYIQWRYNHTRNIFHSDWQSYFTPTARLSWRVAQSNSIRAQIETTSVRPELNMYSVDEKYIDPFFRRKGDAALRMQYRVTPQLLYVSSHRWGIFDIQANYTLTTHAIYIDILHDPARNVYIQTFANGGNCENLDIKASLQYNLIPNCLKIRVSGRYSHVTARTYTRLRCDSWQGTANITFFRNGFTGQLTALTPHSTMDQYGEWYDTPAKIGLSLGYNCNGWSLSAECHNPFMTRQQKVRMELPGITNISHSELRRRANNYIALRISYAFNYGKKHKYENIEEPAMDDSAILPH